MSQNKAVAVIQNVWFLGASKHQSPYMPKEIAKRNLQDLRQISLQAFYVRAFKMGKLTFELGNLCAQSMYFITELRFLPLLCLVYYLSKQIFL